MTNEFLSLINTSLTFLTLFKLKLVVRCRGSILRLIMELIIVPLIKNKRGWYELQQLQLFQLLDTFTPV